jgi:hypothetical protein
VFFLSFWFSREKEDDYKKEAKKREKRRSGIPAKV